MPFVNERHDSDQRLSSMVSVWMLVIGPHTLFVS